MKILTLFQPASSQLHQGMTSFEAEDFNVATTGPGLPHALTITFVGGNSQGHDYAGAVLYPGQFPFMIREKSR